MIQAPGYGREFTIMVEPLLGVPYRGFQHLILDLTEKGLSGTNTLTYLTALLETNK
jgi:hypothetical protein